MYTETMARRGAGSLAKLLALMCVENSKLEQYRLGLAPVTRTGDYSDVMVVDADGRHIPWQRVARLDTDEIRETMRDIGDKLYTCLMNFESPQFAALLRSSAAGRVGMSQAETGARAVEADGAARR